MRTEIFEIQLLENNDRGPLGQHYIRLDNDSRRSRFGMALAPEGIWRFVRGLNFEVDLHFGVYHDDELVAVAQLSPLTGDARALEFGISVHGDYRRHGLGSRLWEHCVEWAKDSGVHEIHVLHADSNQAIIGLCRKYGLAIQRVDGERVGIWSRVSVEKQKVDSEWDLELAAC